MTRRLKSIADCVGLSHPFSVRRDFFGYSHGGPGTDLSLKRQLELCQGQSLGINIILVGLEDFSDTDREEVENAIRFTRDIYEKVDIGIRRVLWWHITNANAGSFRTIDSKSEAKDLTHSFTVNNDFLDVFVVRRYNGADGRSAIDGDTDKDAKNMTGSVVSLNGNFDNSGNTMAHEIGHYLGLRHVSSSTNFVGGNGSSNSNTGITSSQGSTMKQHGFVRDVC